VVQDRKELNLVQHIAPAPEVIAREIVEDLTAALAEFEALVAAGRRMRWWHTYRRPRET
jgi:hypothetical protein